MNFGIKNEKSLYSSLTLRKGEGIRFHKTLNNAHLEQYPGLVALRKLREDTLDTNLVYKQILISPDILETAYAKISKNKGANTPATDGLTLDGLSRKTLEQIRVQLKDHSYEFKPARREYIPKANGKLRPLGIPSPRDKIVQQAMVLILEAVMEKHFRNTSHGFRPNRGCHTALKQISRWNGVEWFIEGDIKSYFDTIDHHVLAHLIKQKIKDQQFLELYWKAVRAGYVETKSGKKIDSTIGTPQGSIISPILANIYLHVLDLAMERMCEESLASGATSKPYKPYRKLHSRVHTLYKRAVRLGNTTKDDAQELRQVKAKRGKLPSTIKGPGYRIYYVRYADDFLVGVNGTRSKAAQIRQAIDDLLKEELKLTLNLEKTKLTYAKDKQRKVLFLGTEIYRNVSRTHNQKFVNKYNPKLKRRVKSRIPASRLSLLMPVQEVVRKLSNQGMCRIDDWKQGKLTPTAKTAWMNLPCAEIVRKYNAVLLGIRNFYSFADNRNRMQLIQFIIQHSCAKTIGRKMRLKTRSKVFKTYGSNLTVREDKQRAVGLKLQKSHKRTGKWLVNPAEALESVYFSLRSKSLLDKSCFICGCTEDIEVHHIRALRGKTKGNMVNTMKALHRKQIPVCHACHRKIHNGLYDGENLKKLRKKMK